MYKRLRERKLPIKWFTSECVEIGQKYRINTVFTLKNPGGGEKQESNQWRGGRRARWPTTPRVARN